MIDEDRETIIKANVDFLKMFILTAKVLENDTLYEAMNALVNEFATRGLGVKIDTINLNTPDIVN